ncbi:uncharacterized protein [Dermacentor albipictus]|uniref:uncharacterized protein isoform X3 n=1 Tax=Dermacentor albipictus TaxID=60249 RepID=UPI0038FCE3A1
MPTSLASGFTFCVCVSEDSQFFTGAGEQSQLLLSSTADSSLAASKDDEATGIGRFCLVAFCLLFVVLVGVLVVVFLNSDFREEKVDNTDEDIFGGSDGGSRTGGSGGSTSRRTPLPVYLTPRTTGDQRRTVPRGQARPGVPAVPVVPATPGMPVSPGAPTEPGVTAGRGVPAGTGVPEGPGVTAGTQPPARPRVPITTPPLTTSRMLTSKHTSPPTMPTTTSTPKITTTSIPIMTVGPNTKRPLPLDSLICTLESPFGGSLLRIPPDGLCSIVVAYPFYDPDALELFQTKKYSSKGFDILVEKAGKQNKTEFGIGISYKNLSVDIFIAVGYQSDPDNNYTACHMVPPNLLNKQLLTPDLYGIYSVRLADVISSLTENPAAWTPTTSFAVSVGLEGRWYTPKDQDGDYQLGMPCTNEIPAWIGKQAREIEMACYNRFYNFTFKIDQKFQAMVGYDKIDGLLFTFDTAETLRSKLCEAKSTATATKFYIVAANIGAVDYDNWCGFGALRRLHMLKALAHFFAYNYTSAAQKSACLLVNP